MNIKQLFNIVEKRKMLFIISIVIIAIGIIGFFKGGFNWDIDFYRWNNTAL
jgi:preprotein translocase subunit SecF